MEGRKMKKLPPQPNLRFTTALALLVLLASGLLTWLGAQLVRMELEEVDRTFDSLLVSRLKEIESGFFGFLAEVNMELVVSTSPASQGAVFRRSPPPGFAPEAVFAVSSSGVSLIPSKREFPNPSGGLHPASGDPMIGFFSSWAASVASGLPGVSGTGWRSWSDGSDSYLFFLHRWEDGTLIVRRFMVREVFDSFLRHRNGTMPRRNAGFEGTIVFSDPAERKMGTIGSYKIEPQEKPRAVLLLRNPLQGFRLQAFAPREKVVENLQTGVFFQTTSLILLSLLVVAFLGFHLYREGRRESAMAMEKVSFVNRVSHELKTPLTNIRMFVELLGMQMDEGKPEERELLETVSLEIDRLSKLINHVLAFAGNQAGPQPPKPRRAIPDREILSILETFRPSLVGKGIQLETRLCAEQEMAFDPDFLAQILGNLVSNVEKYAGSGRFLGVASRIEGPLLRVWVQDHGPGIPPHFSERVFEPFFRIQENVSQTSSGTGIGLSISRDLARFHGGDVILDPSGERGSPFQKAGAKGSCFLVELKTHEVFRNDGRNDANSSGG